MCRIHYCPIIVKAQYSKSASLYTGLHLQAVLNLQTDQGRQMEG